MMVPVGGEVIVELILLISGLNTDVGIIRSKAKDRQTKWWYWNRLAVSSLHLELTFFNIIDWPKV